MDNNSGKALGKAIEAWAKRKSAVVNDLHKLAVRTVIHCITTGYIDYINKLDVAVRDGEDNGKAVSGINLFSFRKWIELKAPVTWQKGDKGQVGSFVFSKSKAEAIKAAFEADPEAFESELAGTPFWRVVKAPDPFEGFDFKKELGKLIGRAKRYLSDPNKKDKVDATGIERAERLAKDLETAAATGKPLAVVESKAKPENKAKPAKSKTKPKAKTEDKTQIEVVVH